MSLTKKRERIEHANELIKVISNHGRRFFYFAKANRVARIEMVSGHLYFRDDYTDEAVHIHKNFSNRNFSHGGTLRSLVEKMADYIRTGERLSIRWIGPDPGFTKGNIWGYSEDEIIKTRDAALKLAIIKQPEAA